ncbi:MAG TPA: anti-sigma regulatory factor [Actinomycetales bacterium]|nr:anti-sigma regulatory factor [Actinomycetales bacterium]
MTLADTEEAAATRDQVELRVPASPAYLAVLRTASAGLAARLDLTLDEIEDLRIAVDEACALLLADGSPDDDLVAVFDLETDVLAVQVTGPARRLPQRESFAWAVLEALVGEIETGTTETGSFIRMRHERARRGR